MNFIITTTELTCCLIPGVNIAVGAYRVYNSNKQFSKIEEKVRTAAYASLNQSISAEKFPETQKITANEIKPKTIDEMAVEIGRDCQAARNEALKGIAEIFWLPGVVVYAALSVISVCASAILGGGRPAKRDTLDMHAANEAKIAGLKKNLTTIVKNKMRDDAKKSQQKMVADTQQMINQTNFQEIATKYENEKLPDSYDALVADKSEQSEEIKKILNPVSSVAYAGIFARINTEKMMLKIAAMNSDKADEIDTLFQEITKITKQDDRCGSLMRDLEGCFQKQAFLQKVTRIGK